MIMPISLKDYRIIRLCALRTIRGTRHAPDGSVKDQRDAILTAMAWARANLHRPTPVLHRVYRTRVVQRSANFAADDDDVSAPDEVEVGPGSLMVIDMTGDPGVYSMADAGFTGVGIFVDESELNREFDATPWRIEHVTGRWVIVDEIQGFSFPFGGFATLADATHYLQTETGA